MLFFQNYSNLYPPNKTLCALFNLSCCQQHYRLRKQFCSNNLIILIR
ncbi:hypothetical protein [Spiroplasma endosymbiont of Dilophus febrilis]